MKKEKQKAKRKRPAKSYQQKMKRKMEKIFLITEDLDIESLSNNLVQVFPKDIHKAVNWDEA